jgi:hypothetical protein
MFLVSSSMVYSLPATDTLVAISYFLNLFIIKDLNFYGFIKLDYFIEGLNIFIGRFFRFNESLN